MCGLFGFIGNKGKAVDLGFLSDLAVSVEARGPEAHGLTQVFNNEFHTYKTPGRISGNLDCLKWVEGAAVVLGHTRFSSSGPACNNKNNQPLQFGQSLALAHNGTIGNFRELKEMRTDFKPITDCDSEIIGWMLQDESPTKIGKRIRKVCSSMGTQFRVSAWRGGRVWDQAKNKWADKSGKPVPEVYEFRHASIAVSVLMQGKLWLYRDGNPIFLHRKPEGLYWCSDYNKAATPLNSTQVYSKMYLECSRTKLPETPEILTPQEVTAIDNARKSYSWTTGTPDHMPDCHYGGAHYTSYPAKYARDSLVGEPDDGLWEMLYWEYYDAWWEAVGYHYPKCKEAEDESSMAKDTIKAIESEYRKHAVAYADNLIEADKTEYKAFGKSSEASRRLRKQQCARWEKNKDAREAEDQDRKAEAAKQATPPTSAISAHKHKNKNIIDRAVEETKNMAQRLGPCLSREHKRGQI